MGRSGEQRLVKTQVPKKPATRKVSPKSTVDPALPRRLQKKATVTVKKTAAKTPVKNNPTKITAKKSPVKKASVKKAPVKKTGTKVAATKKLPQTGSVAKTQPAQQKKPAQQKETNKQPGVQDQVQTFTGTQSSVPMVAMEASAGGL
jgi:hypothetical protein